MSECPGASCRVTCAEEPRDNLQVVSVGVFDGLLESGRAASKVGAESRRDRASGVDLSIQHGHVQRGYAGAVVVEGGERSVADGCSGGMERCCFVTRALGRPRARGSKRRSKNRTGAVAGRAHLEERAGRWGAICQ